MKNDLFYLGAEEMINEGSANKSSTFKSYAAKKEIAHYEFIRTRIP